MNVISSGIRSQFSILEKLADDGNEEARKELSHLDWERWHKFQEDIKHRAKAGKIGWPPAIGTLLKMADFCIPLLLWLAEHQRENVKQYSRNRWMWPSFVHLMKRGQKQYEALLPIYDKAGTKIIKQSPIELGANLGLNINAGKTKFNHLFLVAAHSVFAVVKTPLNNDKRYPVYLRWLRYHHPPLRNLKEDKLQVLGIEYLKSIGEFRRSNFNKWRPVFDTFLTLNYGPMSERVKRVCDGWPDEMVVAVQSGSEISWLHKRREKEKMSEEQFFNQARFLSSIRRDFFNDPPLQLSDLSEIQKIVERRKKPNGQWIELKDEILKRICDLSPA